MLSVLVLSALVVIAAVISASVGPYNIALTHVASALLGDIGINVGSHTRTEALVIEQLRLPRVCVAMLAGAALAVSGTAMQALFRNPMADPGIVGVSSGAATGAVLAIALGLNTRSVMTLPALAFAGALLSTLTVYGIAVANGRLSMAALLLAGIAVTSFLGAIISAIITYLPNDEQLRGIVFWLAGGLSGSSWTYVRIITAPIVLGVLAITLCARELNLLLLGDDIARTSGVHVSRTRTLVIIAVSVITGAAVAVSGTIAFIGLVVPHILRLIVGPDHRVLLPASALGGALFLLVADTIARLAVRPAELQVGVVTAIVGAPIFVLLLLRNSRQLASS